MGKGCCAKTSIETPPKYEEQKSITASERSSIKSEPVLERDSPNDHLLEYQEKIANDPNNKSLTKNVLTRALAMEYANIRGSSDEGLGQCVFVNVNNTNCLVPYAATPDCYNIFPDFFGEIIEDIHGLPAGNNSLYPTFGNLKRHVLTDLNNFNRKRARVMYCDMIIRRNIQDIPWAPFMDSGTRKQVISQIEPKIRSILESSEEIALIPVEWEIRMNLIKNELDDCGVMNAYPDDRLMLVFKTRDNITEGCVLNFDDHVQYITSTYDGRIGEVFNRLYNIVCHETLDEVNYAAHSIFGHLTLSPAYVGTGYTVRILARFPFVSRLADVNSLIKQFDAFVVDECVHKKNGVIILSNTKTFNKSEDEIFTDIVLAYNKLVLLEDELELSTPMSIQRDVASVEKLKTLTNRIFEVDSKSYTKKYLTEALIKQYEGVKTRFGTLLNNCIRHNSFYPNSLFPRACDAECYITFQSFFNPILLETNSAKGFTHGAQPKYGSTIGDKIYQLHHPNIYSYRVRFSRNFDSFPFPIMMSDSDRAEVERVMLNMFDEIPVELEGEYVPLASLKYSIHLEDILKYKLITPPNEIDSSTGLYMNWPSYRGIYVTKSNPNYPNIVLAILVNFTDHIKVIALDTSGKSLGICYDRAIKFMKFLDLRFQKRFAYKFGYGFVTTVPSSVGCGLRVSAMVKLEHLGKHREVLENECIALQLVYRGSHGHGTAAQGYVFDISVKLNLNVTEKWIIMIFVQKLKELINIERQYNPQIAIPSNEEELFDNDDDYDSDNDDEYVDDYEEEFDEAEAEADEEYEIRKHLDMLSNPDSKSNLSNPQKADRLSTNEPKNKTESLKGKTPENINNNVIGQVTY